MFGDVDSGLFAPAEEKEAAAGAEQHGQTEPNVVRHEHQHQQITD